MANFDCTANNTLLSGLAFALRHSLTHCLLCGCSPARMSEWTVNHDDEDEGEVEKPASGAKSKAAAASKPASSAKKSASKPASGSGGRCAGCQLSVANCCAERC